VIAHTVLFRPRADLSSTDRDGLAHALLTVLRDVPSLRRVRVGPRVRIGRGYESLMRTDYTFAALLEFDDVEGLRTYLDHPAHEQLAARFFDTFEEALMYDFDLEEGSDGIERLKG
jgi:hypothetical protein